MFKKFSLVLLCFILCLTVTGCKKKTDNLSVDRGDEPSVSDVVEEIPEFAVNPLTGVEDLTYGKEKDRPVAFSINNINVAQPVQTGLGKADIVYETEVEGGITRLVAVYQDVSKIEKLGTVRSARYAFIDLAMGHNAFFVHHGQDNEHAGPHLKDVDRLVVSENVAGIRLKNGLASEHTLYAYGDAVWKKIVSEGYDTKNSNTGTWQSFATADTPVTFTNVANKVTVPFSASYHTSMQYDATTGKYIRISNGTERKDYVTGESLYFKNVFVLSTTIRAYSPCTYSGGHMEVSLESGDGYYLSNGTYTPIKWSKGAASNPFKFTLEDGTPLTVNAGNSWVCIADMTRSQPVFE